MSHKVKNPIPLKSTTMVNSTEQVDVTKYMPSFKTKISAWVDKIIFEKTVAIMTTEDIVIPTKKKQWIDVPQPTHVN